MSSVEQLYKDYEVLANAKENAGTHEREYMSILSAVKCGSSEKRLASQFISRFCKYFPSLIENVLDAQIDLIEDTDAAIRRQAIKDLPSICRCGNAASIIPRVADVLVQLLQTNDSVELSLVHNALVSLFRTNAMDTLTTIFQQILQGDEVVREATIKFMGGKMMNKLNESVWTKEVEEHLVNNTIKVLEDVTGDEFVSLIKILSSMKSMQTLVGRQQLVDIVCEQADLQQAFEATDSDSVDRLIQCIRQALPFFSKNVHSKRFVEYISIQVLPQLTLVASPDEALIEGEKSGESNGHPKTTSVDLQIEILKLFAEMVINSGDITKLEQCLEGIFTTLIGYMPLPVSDESENIKPANTEEPKYNFSQIECLIFSFHLLARKSPEFLTAEKNAERLKDFKLRMQCFARTVQQHVKHLRLALQGKSGESLKTDQNKLKVLALKTTTNINILIKDLLHNPPAYKSTISLSWKPIAKAPPISTASAGEKRPNITPISFDSPSDSKQSKTVPAKSAQTFYSPPGGRFSDKAGQYNPGCFRGRGRFRFRGRRGGRW